MQNNTDWWQAFEAKRAECKKLKEERDLARRDYECMNKFREHAEYQRDQLREALERAADDLDMISRVENNYLAKSGAERCRTALKATEGE